MDCTKFINEFCSFNGDLADFLNLSQVNTDDKIEFNHGKLFQQVATCKYYLSDNLLFASRPLNSLFMLHINARSLNKNFSSLDELIQNFPNLPDIIGVSETWLKSNLEQNISIAGYEFNYQNAKKRAGGVAFYISLVMNLITKMPKSELVELHFIFQTNLTMTFPMIFISTAMTAKTSGSH